MSPCEEIISKLHCSVVVELGDQASSSPQVVEQIAAFPGRVWERGLPGVLRPFRRWR